MSQIDKAALICGWEANKGAGYVRKLVLNITAELLRDEGKNRQPRGQGSVQLAFLRERNELLRSFSLVTGRLADMLRFFGMVSLM